MMLGQHPGEAYADSAGRMYYDSRDGGRTYRTDTRRRGLYQWDGTAWRQLRGDTQFGPWPSLDKWLWYVVRACDSAPMSDAERDAALVANTHRRTAR